MTNQRLGSKKSSKRLRLFLGGENRSGLDIPFLLIVFLLLIFGLIMLYSASSAVAYYRRGDAAYFIKRQVLFAIVGVIAMLIISNIDYHVLRQVVWLAYLVSLVLLVIVLFMKPLNESRRWIILLNGKMTFQPSEIAKMSLILAFAHLGCTNEKRMKTLRGIAPFIVILIPVGVLMVLEPHLSGTILIGAICAIILFSAGAHLALFGTIFAVLAVGLVAALIIKPDLVPVAADRIAIWQHPENDPTDAGMQIVQGLRAIGSGGLTGLGLGNSRQKHMYVPEPQNDYIFPIICEELGFIGALFIIAMFVFLLIRGIHVAMTAKDRFGTLLVVGIIAQVILQSSLNILVVTNTIPNTGISLPFFSYGGSSLMMLLAEMGVVLAVSRQGNIERG